jgi:glutamate/tyrosine decarboxylase-like PLP-dependent enzyme
VSGPFEWHPDPELIGYADERNSRAALEALSEAAVRAALDWLYGTAAERPIRPEDYGQARGRFFGEGNGPAPAPAQPATWDAVLEEFSRRVAPDTFNAQNTGSFSYFTPPPLPMSIAGETLAQWINQGVDVFHAGPVGTFVEEEVTSWLRDLVGFAEGSWGVLTSGGVMANAMGLAVARDIHLRKILGSSGPPRGRDLEDVRIYASDQAHFSISRGLELLGFPSSTLCLVGSDDRFKLCAEPVREAIREDRASGRVPLAIAAVAGSTNTGSVDEVDELADLSSEEGLWLHVDAAYGGAVRLSSRDANRVSGLERADSLTIDPHKWFFQAYDIGALLVRERSDLLETFHREPEYYAGASREGTDEPINWYQYSMEGTRRFRALKLWMSWKHLGTEGLGRLIEMNDDLAAYLAGECRGSEDLEASPPEPELSVVCFRHLPTGHETMAPERLDSYQTALQRALEVSGEAWVSTTTLRGRTFLRAGIVNYLAGRRDVDRMLAALRRLSEGVLEQLDG